MARGWESKSVEDQIAARDEAAAARKAPPAPANPERETRRRTLELARTRALQDLQLACDKRHRAMLEQTIAHLDQELRQS